MLSDPVNVYMDLKMYVRRYTHKDLSFLLLLTTYPPSSSSALRWLPAFGSLIGCKNLSISIARLRLGLLLPSPHLSVH